MAVMQIGDSVQILFVSDLANPNAIDYQHVGRVKHMEGSRIDISVRSEKGLFTISVPRPWIEWATEIGWKVRLRPVDGG